MGWASTRRWPGHRLLDSLANTILDLGLPRIRAWLQQRFGPEADVARVRLDGGIVSLEDARLPLGGAAVLYISTARARVGTGASKLRLLELRGAIRVEAARRFEAPVEFDDVPGEDAQWVHGRLQVADARWTASHGEDEQAPLSGAVFVRLSSESWSLREGAFSVAAARVSLAAHGTMQDGAEMPVEAASLEFSSARAGHLFDALLALSGQDLQVTRALPWTALLDGELEFDARGGLRAELGAGLGESQRLSVRGALALDGGLSDVRIEGSFDPRVVPLLEPWTQHVTASLPLVCGVDGNVEGSLELPRWQGRLELPQLELAALSAPRLTDLRVDARGDLESGSLHATAMGPAGARVQLFAGWTPSESTPGKAELHIELGRSSLQGKASFDADGAIQAEATGKIELDDLAGLAPALARHLTSPARAEFELELEGQLPTLELRATAAVDRFRVRQCEHDLRDAKLHLAGTVEEGQLRGTLHLDTPTSALRLEPLSIDREGSLEGSRLIGELSSQDLQSFVRIEDPVELLPDAHVEGTLNLGGSLDAPVLDGPVRAARVPLRLPAGEGRVKVSLTEAAGRIRVERERFIYERVAFGWASSQLRVSGELPYSGERGAGPAATLELVEAHPALVATLASILAGSRVATVEGHKPAPWVVPSSLRAFGVLAVQIDGDVDAQLGVQTGSSSLMARVGLVQAQLGGSVEGHVALADLGIIGVLDRLPVKLERRGRGELKLALEGTTAAPAASFTVELGALGLSLGRERLGIDGLTLVGRADARRVELERLGLRRGSGELAGSGEWRFDRSSARAKLDWRELMIDDLPLDLEGKRRVRQHVTGRSSGRLDVHWVGQGLAGLEASGRVMLEDAAYPFLYRFRDTLRTLGLPEPRIAGTTPARVDLKFDGRRLLLDAIRGAVRGCAIEGQVGITHANGALDGQLHATVPATYLSHSALLRFPAALTGDLRVPVAVGGSVDNPRFEPDVLATLGGVFGTDTRASTRSRVDDWFEQAKGSGIPDDLRRYSKRRPEPSESRQDTPGDAAQPDESDELIRDMMARGVDMAVIERLLDKRRKRNKG